MFKCFIEVVFFSEYECVLIQYPVISDTYIHSLKDGVIMQVYWCTASFWNSTRFFNQKILNNKIVLSLKEKKKAESVQTQP